MGHGRKSLNAERREVGERARWEGCRGEGGGALKEHVLGELPLPVSPLLLNSRGVVSKAEVLCALGGMASQSQRWCRTLAGNDQCGAVPISPSHPPAPDKLGCSSSSKHAWHHSVEERARFQRQRVPGSSPGSAAY